MRALVPLLGVLVGGISEWFARGTRSRLTGKAERL